MQTANVPDGQIAESRLNDWHCHCFAVGQRMSPRPCAIALDACNAEPLAALLPLLGCGEEAAVIGFDRLARFSGLDAKARQALQAIAADERQHDALLRGLQAALPAASPIPAMRQAARRFHLSLTAGGAAIHLARIAGVDAAVCTILSRLLRPKSALAGDRDIASVLGHIRRDETRHVAISRRIALASIAPSAARDAAGQARAGLAELLSFGSQALERLGVDPDALDRDVRRLPPGLFPG